MTHNQAGSFDGRTTLPAGNGDSAHRRLLSQSVIAGPGSFLVEANDYTDFGEALKRKLLLELIAAASWRMRR
jgi:hypothetical protein